jgi:hypothetical protein
MLGLTVGQVIKLTLGAPAPKTELVRSVAVGPIPRGRTRRVVRTGATVRLERKSTTQALPLQTERALTAHLELTQRVVIRILVQRGGLVVQGRK